MHLFFLMILAFYFLPAIIGWNKKDSGAIILVNIFLGWTFVGWIVALVWAITSAPALTYVVVNQPTYPVPPAYAPPPQGLYCSSCGKLAPPGGAFCSYCGRRMS